MVLAAGVSQAAIMMSAVAESQAQLGKEPLPAHLCGCWRVQFLSGCWTEGFSFSLAVGHQPPSVPRHVGLSIRQLTTWQLASSVKHARKASKSVIAFYNLISEVIA